MSLFVQSTLANDFIEFIWFHGERQRLEAKYELELFITNYLMDKTNDNSL